MVEESGSAPPRAGIRADFFTDLDQVRLRGCRCNNCGAVFIGSRLACENCTSTDITETILGDRGTLYSYTVVRHRPPLGYRGPDDPYVPFAEGLVELADGIRVFTKLSGVDIEAVQIGETYRLEVRPLYTDEAGTEVMEFAFRREPGGAP